MKRGDVVKICYRGADVGTEPTELTYSGEFGYPNRCDNGDMMFDNTHFATKADAWKSLSLSVNAQVSIAGRRVENARQALKEAERFAGESAERFAIVMDGLRRFESQEDDG